MKIKANQRELYNAIKTASKAVSSKSSLPILSGILIKTERDRLRVVGTDLELGIELNVDAEVMDPGGVVLPDNAKRIIKELPPGQVEISVDDSNQIKITAGNSEFQLNGSSSDEYPSLPEVDSKREYELQQSELKDALNRVKFATSNDESRTFLTGALFLADEYSIELVATDSYRLAYTELMMEGVEYKEEIIPAPALDEVYRLLGNSEDPVKITADNNTFQFDIDGTTVITRIIEGDFPNYEQVIPDDYETRVKLDRQELLNATKRASLVANDSNIIQLKFGDRLVIEAQATDIGQAHEEVAIEKNGEDTEIAFNAGYLIDVLKVLDDNEIVLELSGELSPGVVKEIDNDSYIHVIMPVRST